MNDSEDRLGLSELIHPRTLPEFMSAYQKGEPFLVDHGVSELESLRSLPFLESLNSLLQSWTFPVQAHLPDLRDEVSSVDISTEEAPEYFKKGMGLLFNDVDRISPHLGEWLEKIRSDLGISNLSYKRCLVYATPDGKGTAPHFDQNINFVLQIHGTKVWTMAPNAHVANPLTRHTMGQEPDVELATYAHSSFPMEMPKSARNYTLKPGTLLYVPRGYWHSTEAAGDALALNFTFTAPSWLDLFTAALRSRLALSEDWRATAEGLSDPKAFNLLLEELVGDLPNWKSDDILGVTEYR